MSKKKFNLKKPLKLMEDFAAGELDNSATTATDTKTTVKVDQSNQSGAEIRAEIIADVDTILTNLETLSKQIQEGFEQIKQDVLDGNEEVLEIFSSLNESSLIVEKDVTLGGLMAYSEDDYEYLKAEAKKLGVTVTVASEGDPESMYDDMGYDTLSFRGPKDAVLKVAAISGHDQDICPENEPDCGGYSIEESAEVSEADDTIPKKVMDLVWYRRKANKAMDKVNKVKQNAVAIDLAAKGLDGSDKQEKAKKEKLKAKADSAAKKADELEKAVRDKFDDRSIIVQKAIQKKDIEGRLATIKQETGMSEDPQKSKELKDKMKDLQTQLKKEDDAIKQIETDAEPAVDDAKDKLEKHKAEVKKLKDGGYKEGGLPDGKEGDETTLTDPEGSKQIYHKLKDDEKKGSFDEEKVQAAIDKAKEAKEAYTKVDGNNNPVKIAELEIAVLTAELAMAEGKGEDAEKIKEIKDKIKAAELTTKRKVAKVPSTRPKDGKNSKADIIARYQKLIDGTDDEEKKKKYQAKIDGLQEESEERFLDPEFMSVLESELLEFEKELSEGNAFGAARAEAIAKGEKTFKVGDEEYDVEDVGAEDKENAEEYAEEEGIATEAVTESSAFKMGSVADRFRSLL